MGPQCQHLIFPESVRMPPTPHCLNLTKLAILFLVPIKFRGSFLLIKFKNDHFVIFYANSFIKPPTTGSLS